MRFFSSRVFALAFAAALIAALSSCGKKPPAPASAPAAKHAHHPPHDGTPVVLGDEAYHLEFVLDPAAGKLSAFVLDGEMENFIRVTAPSFEVVATVGGGAKQTLVFTAIADSATGETVGDTALFEAKAGWLKTNPTFGAVLKKIEIRGTPFTDIAFNVPKGNDKD